jgi:hypothetical protein
MINGIGIYKDAGYKAGEARKQHDESRAKFHNDWFKRAYSLESKENRPEIQKAFNDGYKEGAHVY